MANYSLVFTKSLEIAKVEVDKYICIDNKIHIRLRDFNTEMLLIGFEKKLTYLLSYLLNYAYIPKLVGKYTYENILQSFLLDDTVVEIIDFIGLCIDDKSIAYEGILLKPNYKRDKKTFKYFGDTNVKFFPLRMKNNIIEAGDFEYFLEVFNLDLYQYLFNDDYVIWLHKKNLTANKKFDIRKLKKSNKQRNKNKDIVKLW